MGTSVVRKVTPGVVPAFLHPPSSEAGWSSLVARRAHNPKVAGPNPAPALASLTHTQDTPAYYAGMKGKVEANFTLEQTEELKRVLHELGRSKGMRKGQSTVKIHNLNSRTQGEEQLSR